MERFVLWINAIYGLLELRIFLAQLHSLSLVSVETNISEANSGPVISSVSRLLRLPDMTPSCRRTGLLTSAAAAPSSAIPAIGHRTAFVASACEK
ncbi:hypothetical protein SFRURICE_005760 [Spodoptera frugiperda]|uniref:SFRICE_026994 n=1 Tax=Spodoptera frugiperda TaxID=7108 RepID=A0A2H1WWB2_SPOFR|nr:hypothetical protein SFRURICE_005760 [Spodoptera frugiperda]